MSEVGGSALTDDSDMGPRERAKAGTRGKRRKARPLWQELVVLALVAVLVAYLVKTFLVGVYFIPSGSMENTLLIGDRVAVDKLTYRLHDIHRGDVVVFNGVDSFTPEGAVSPASTNPLARAVRGAASLVGLAPPNERDFIKRVIGVPGDHVVCCDKQGRITVNGTPLDEPYIYPGDAPSTTAFDVIVPEGRLWVMGDHRGSSADSRSHLGDPGGGTVPEDRVIGRARAVIWPFSELKRLPTPATFQQSTLSAGTSAGTGSLADRAPPTHLSRS